ncbi:protein EXORDIUM-like [Diospyros lotus]|uniref:protein EXORDIUM-like n=1 Tax=Diospyros lotus TaxID=55363 RepID=UPI00224E7562|nr:protein EXORDIUM-like [Diospyros lotus]
MEFSHLLPLVFSLCLSLLLIPLASATRLPPSISYHHGLLLAGNLNLSLLWYGRFDPLEKTVVRTFVASLTLDRSLSFTPDVMSWWNKVQTYLPSGATVRIAKETDDESASAGNVLTQKSLPDLLARATAGEQNTVAVIFAGKDVAIEGTCQGTCYLHRALGKQPYIAVGNPEKRCPGKCAVPFHLPDEHFCPPLTLTLEPPSGNVGADAVIIHFASALAETVTNPFNSGFFGGEGGKYQAATACVGLFASNALPGFPSNVRVDPHTGGAFNAHGVNNTKFLLPALWDVKTSSCWTPL